MLESKWGLRFVAFLLALFMFLSVNDVFENVIDSEEENGGSEVIEGAPVEVIYDEEEYYVSGVPETVNVQLYGNNSNIKRLQTTRDFDVVIDLSESGVGDYEEYFTVQGLPEDVTAEVRPETANITIQELVTETHEVEAEVSESRIGPNHHTTNVSVSPETVTVMGGESEMNRIQYVRATLSESARITENRVEEAEIGVFDSQFNRLDVRVDPETVRVDIEVAERSKEVPVNYEVTGDVADGYTLNDVSLNYDEVEVFGGEETLSQIDSIDAEVDVEGLSDSETQDVELNVPEAVSKTEPAVLQADIEIEAE